MSRSGNDRRSQTTSLDAKGQRASLERSPRPSPRPSPRQSVEERRKQMAVVEEKVYPGRSPEKSDSLDRADKVVMSLPHPTSNDRTASFHILFK